MHPAAIGPYQVVRELGRGGMGEVFLAHDSRLDRHVAIKSLPAHLATDPDRLARFQREAKVLASLNHPGIGAIYGLEEVEGHQYLILEYIEGETLADRLVSGAIPVDETLAIARQIAESLEAAHEKGVIHRDLKPGNVMVPHEGVVKVLDFGLARTADGSPSSTSALGTPDSPTMPIQSPTIPGAIMGTAGYMSPEQARGKPVDKRSDIFSFGCVLYEMLSGSGPFPGETITDSLGAILHREPDWTRIPPSTPARVRELLRACLVKDRRNRLHDIGDARLELERTIAGHEWAPAAAPVSSPKRNWALLAGLVSGAAVLAGAAGWLIAHQSFRPAPVLPPRVFHVSTAVPVKPEFSHLVGIAPDARFVVYKATPEKVADSTHPGGVLVVRRLDRDETKVLDGTEGVIDASLSADGRWIAFAATKDAARTKIVLKKIALDDGRTVGTPETLCELPTGDGMSLCWSSDREIIVALAWRQTLLAVPASGGEPRVVVREEQSKEIDNWGMVRPLVPGRSVLASRWALVGQSIKERTEVVDLATGERTPLFDNTGLAQLVGGDFIIARRNLNTIVAQRFDTGTLRPVGDQITVWSGKNNGNPFFASPNGTLAMASSSGDISNRRLMKIDGQGQPQSAGAPTRAYGEIAVSPDGGRVGLSMDSPDESELETNLWIYDLTRLTFTRLPTSGGAWQTVWSGDGERVAHSSVTENEFSIWERRADGSGEAVKIFATPNPQVFAFPEAWSPDGKTLAIMQVDLSSPNGNVLMLERASAGTMWTATPYLNSPADEHGLRFSPDGKWVTYCSTESGRHECYVQRFTGAANGAEDARTGRVQISTDGNDGACWWSPDGKEIRYIDGDKKVMSVQVQTEPRFSVSLPKVLYSIKELKTRNYSWMPDGHLIAVLQGESERPSRIDLVINFLGEVQSKLPPAR